jgi:predicted amidohydrolase
MICFDWFFPEVLRILALKGAQIVCHPSNLVLPFCQRTLLGVAVQNRVFVITANRVGTEHGVRFTGMSQIVSPDMKTLAVSSKNREEVRIVEVDPKEADSKKISERNDLWADRRVDLYGPLLDGWERKVK